MLFQIFTAKLQMLHKKDLENRITRSLTHGAESCTDFKLLCRAEGTRGHKKEGRGCFSHTAGPARGAAASASEQQPAEFKLSLAP